MTSTLQAVTAEELFRMPDDGWRHLLIRGELRKRPYAGRREGFVSSKITAALGGFIRAHSLGEGFVATGFVLEKNPDTVLAPNLAYVALDRARAFREIDFYLPEAPDLAVEITSPADAFSEVEEKVVLWAEHGCKVLLVVHPEEKRVVLFRPDELPVILSDDDRLEIPDLLPGFSSPVKSFFE
jgi:Uma2 family endonuclease